MGATQGLNEFEGQLYAFWKGQTGDDRIFYSFYNGSYWVEQSLAGGNTSTGPGLGTHDGKLYLAWKGEGSDERLFALDAHGGLWSFQRDIPGFASSTGPALADYNGQLYAAWKGMLDDEAIWFSSSVDGTSWSAQQTIPNVATSVGPSLCTWQGRLYAAWKGMGNDQALWFASFDGNAWSPQAQIPGVASSTGPAIAAYQEKVYAVWKGMIGDEALYYSYFDGTSWVPQQIIPGVASSVGAALAGYGDRLYAMWTGAGTDQNLWFSYFDGTSWALQALAAGSSGPDTPLNVGVSIQYQETSQWCWIAVAASIAHFYDPNSSATQGAMMTSIGRQLNSFPSSVDCSGDAAVQAAHPDLAATLADPYSKNAEFALESVGIPQMCIKSGGVGDALNVNGNNAGYRGKVTLAQVAAEVDAGRPVCVDITWNSGIGSHVVIIAGVLDDKILVLDPGNGESTLPFETFPANYFGGATLDGFTFTKAG